VRRPEMETAEEKLSFLANNTACSLSFDEVQPDKAHNWVNLSNNDFDTLLPLASKGTKAAKTAEKERAIFKLFSLGVSTSRDDWVYGESEQEIRSKTAFLIDVYNTDLERSQQRKSALDASELTYSIKWTRAVKSDLSNGIRYNAEQGIVIPSAYRPFDAKMLHFNGRLVEVQYQQTKLFGERGTESNKVIMLTDAGSQKPFMVLACQRVFDYHFVGAASAASGVSLYRYDEAGNRADNITDWALKQFRQHYEQPSPQPSPASGRGRSAAGGEGKAQRITKEAIFHYCYAVLHDPLYREKYALNLKREFPRIPFYENFWQWAAWGEALMKLHIGYESVEPFKLERTDIPDEKVRAAGLQPKALLRADEDAGSITQDSETTLRGIPPEAWDYKLGNRCALEWALDQYKEKKPKDPTIREKFDTYRFADYKEKVIDLRMRLTTVSVETEQIAQAMKQAAR